jgi:enamine deaminase RidA (YjgF/YER057c/UK114 family)
MTIIKKLAALGYEFTPAPIQTGTFPFHSAVRHGDLVFTSGQIPLLGDVQVKGLVGSDLTLEEAKYAAEVCAVNCLRAVTAVADVDRIDRIIKLFGMVNTAPGFNDTSGVINGASELMVKLFGDKGYHARSAVGMVLPGNWAVEVEMVVAVR